MMNEVTINIDEVKSEYVYDCFNDELIISDELKEKWNSLEYIQRQDYFETKEIQLSQKINKLDHEQMLLELAEELECRFDLECDFLSERVDSEDVKVFKKALDKIFGSICLYEPKVKINAESRYTTLNIQNEELSAFSKVDKKPELNTEDMIKK